MASGGSAARAAEEPPPPEPPAEQKPPPQPPAQEEFSFLPLVHDIIKWVPQMCSRAIRSPSSDVLQPRSNSFALLLPAGVSGKSVRGTWHSPKLTSTLSHTSTWVVFGSPGAAGPPTTQHGQGQPGCSPGAE
ncbi:mediator of RNA polymerase II transcription subunit 9 isoform X4 [Strix uralensis]|uniref:mediator of RNA polymerase II transcription subunit 9 isoform X4 n=1 Tax=Strix uralensis TaxID=36305 RepID=UPI003DA2CB48